MGALGGLAECLLSLSGPATVLVPGLWWEVLANYVLVLLLLSLLAGPVLSLLFKDAAARVGGAMGVGGIVVFVPFLLLQRDAVQGNPLSTNRLLVLAGAAVTLLLLTRLLLEVPVRWERRRLWGGGLLLAAIGAGIGLASGGGAEAGSAAAPPPARGNAPNVLFVLVDATRADRLSLFGYSRPTTPNLDAFSREGLVFERARAESSWTKPSVSTLFTGLPPLVHGQLSWRRRLPGEVTTLAECFRSAGYGTAAFSDNPVVSPVFGFQQGFEHFRWHSGWPTSAFQQGTSLGRVMRHFGVPDLRSLFFRPAREPGEWGAHRLSRMFLDWLAARKRKGPWLAYLHYMEPHSPYEPPGEWRRRFQAPGSRDPGRHLRLPHNIRHPWQTAPEPPADELRLLNDLYDGEIAYWDSEFGRLIEELRRGGRLANTIVVVTSDHGEEFYDHGGWEHGNSLYDELLHVPLLLAGPGVPKGRCSVPVSLKYVLPTLLDLAGIEPPAATAFPLTRSLLPLPEGFGTQEAAHAPDRSRSSFALIRGSMKWILSTSPEGEIVECYDLRRDKAEQRNLADRQDPATRRAALEEIRRRRAMEEEAGLRAGDATPSRELIDSLRGMGYVR